MLDSYLSSSASGWNLSVLSLIVAAGFGFLAGVLFILPDVKRWRLRADLWLARSNEHEADADYYRSLLGWLNKSGKPPVKNPPYSYPLSLPIGTRANPVVSPLGHPAYASTITDLLDDCGYRE